MLLSGMYVCTYVRMYVLYVCMCVCMCVCSTSLRPLDSSEVLPTQQGYYVGVSGRSTAGNFASKGLARSPYVATRVGLEPATPRTKGDKSTIEPPRPI